MNLFLFLLLPSIALQAGVFKCDIANQTNLKKDAEVVLCIHLHPRYQRMSFKIAVDDYSILNMEGMFAFVNASPDPKSSFVAQLGSTTSEYPSLFHDRTNKFTVPVFNLVIKVDKGTVTSLFWDNGCFDCNVGDGCKSETVSLLSDSAKTVTEEVNQ